MAFSKKKSGSEKRKRAPIIGFRATDQERSQIEAAADRAGLTVGSYVRARALEKPTTRAVRRPTTPIVHLAQLLGVLGATGGVLQEMQKQLRETGKADEPELSAALADFRTAASLIMQTLGKRPYDY